MPDQTPQLQALSRLTKSPRSTTIVLPANVGLWRSWERASMAWKRSSVRSRSGPPINQQLARLLLPGLVSFGVTFLNTFTDTAPRLSGFPPTRTTSGSGFAIFRPFFVDDILNSLLMELTVACTLSGIS